MSEIILDAATVATLSKAFGTTRVCDPEGRTVGYLVSPEFYKQAQTTLYDEAFNEITEEDVNEVLADPRRHTTEDVFKLLKGN